MRWNHPPLKIGLHLLILNSWQLGVKMETSIRCNLWILTTWETSILYCNYYQKTSATSVRIVPAVFRVTNTGNSHGTVGFCVQTLRKNLTLILSAWTTTTMLRLLNATTKKLILTNGSAAFLATISFKAATMAVALVFRYQEEEVVVFFRKLESHFGGLRK